MKKAKLMLTALGIVAVLGTAFAFKADKFAGHVIFTGALNQPGGATACTDRLEGAALTSDPNPTIRASVSSTLTGCPAVVTFAIDN